MIKSIGHEENKLKLKKVIKANTISHAYLFVGKKGVGKKLIATEFAKEILCNNWSGEACNNCESCKTFENSSDFKFVTPEKDVIKVDMIREMSVEIFLKPTISKRKVFIIDDAETMNEQAQNALLKILEEPPEYVTIILVSSNKEKLLNTIKSRVTEVAFNGLSKEEIRKILKDEVSEDALNFSNGSVSKAIEFMKDDNFIVAKELADTFLTRDFLKINRKLDEIKSDKSLKTSAMNILEKVMYIYYNNLKEDGTFDIKLIESIEESIQNIKRNANVDLTLDVLNISACKL